MRKNDQQQKEWDEHWQRLERKRSLFGLVCELERKQFISRFVNKVLDTYFLKPGLYLDAGCGTSQTSMRLRPKGSLSLSTCPAKRSKSRAI
jgi:hypothetical protein